MNYPKWIKPLFIIASLYDAILGFLFLTIPLTILSLVNVTPPNHIGYIQFPAFLLIIFAIMFFKIASNPIVNRDLIIYGILLKVSYCTVVFTHWLIRNIPPIWVQFGFYDLIFLILFVMAFRTLKKSE